MIEHTPHAGRRKIAILGGGMSGLAAALELTTDPSWKERYDVTIYQVGWRLGGKCATGRNALRNQRIEEHGLHVWFGCYENAFRLLRECYRELGRPSGHPFRTIENAFRPVDSTPVGEFVNGEWRLWPVNYPPNNLTPGTGGWLPAWENLKHLITFADQMFAELPPPADAPPPPRRQWSWRKEAERPVISESHGLLKKCHAAVHAESTSRASAGGAARRMVGPVQRWRHRRAALSHLRAFKRQSKRLDITQLDDEMRRKWTGIDLAVTVIIGFLVDGVLFCGTDSIDDEDLRAWLTRHGALESTVWSGPVQALYDLCFAFENGETGSGHRGDPGRPNFAAGAALEIALRIGLTYSGSVCYELQSGMGEVVIAPIYEVLEKRGVVFEFFHKVKKVGLSADGKSVARVFIERQARLKGGSYAPFINVKGLKCWPSAPLLDQLDNGEALRGFDLESHWTTWTGEDRTLEAGRDFDDIILATSLGPVRSICEELIRTKRSWRKMVDTVTTVQTQSVQLWMDATLEELGWPHGRVPLDATPEPFDVWSDMSQLLNREAWPAGGPRSVQFLCGPLPGDFAGRSPSDSSVPAQALEMVRATTRSWLMANVKALWPRVAPAGSPAFHFDVLHDETGPTRVVERLNSQFFRANISPSELYVQSPAGSTKYRLRPDQSGCKNLFLAGDWTRTPFNAGCIEAATMSGIAAAQALTGTARAGELPHCGAIRLLLGLIRASLCVVNRIVRRVLRVI